MPEGEFTDFQTAADRALDGDTVLVLVESPSGTAQPLIDIFPDDLPVYARFLCAPTCLADVGAVAEALELDGFNGGALVVEDAQWADPTSLGRLQRLLKQPSRGGLLLLIAHRPLGNDAAWWFASLADTARNNGHLAEIALPPSESTRQLTELDTKAIDLLIASRLVTGTLPVPVAGALLGLTEEQVLSVGEELLAQGLLRQSRGGYLPSPEVPVDFAGEVRTGLVATRLAATLESSGERPAVIGSLLLAGGHPERAFPYLVAAAAEASDRDATGEAHHLAMQALSAAESAGIRDPSTLGRLHLIAARFLRDAGRTQTAADHLDHATSSLVDEERVEALSLAASVADDAQRPQDAERIAAMAELEAVHTGHRSRLGALFAFRARALNRIGFAVEAEALLERADNLLADADEDSRRLALRSRAWIHFDRGQVAIAETEFSRLRDDAERREDDVSLADHEAWRARALFLAGRPDEALEAVAVVQRVAALEEVEAPLFLAQLALTEASLTYGRFELALESAERVLDLVERQLPAWENMARSLRAQALLRLGRADDAAVEIRRALELTPAGANGWRWRVRCEALSMEIDAAMGQRWPKEAAEDLAELLLQSRLHGWAAELLTAIAVHGGASRAEEAVAVAVEAGQPMLAARAVHVGDLWDDPIATPVILALRAIDRRIPAEWREAWGELPHVTAGLARPEPTEDAESAASALALSEALRRAGLSSDLDPLSPAQRLGRRLTARRANRVLRVIAATLGVVVVAALTALGVGELAGEQTAPTTTLAASVGPLVTEPMALEETQITHPSGSRPTSGLVEHRGGNARSGVLSTEGPRQVEGYFWKVTTDGPIEASPIAYGLYLYVGTTEGTFYALDKSNGDVVWSLPPEGRISATPAIGQGDAGEGQTPTIVVIVDDDGVVRGHDAADANGLSWTVSLGARIRSSPVVAEEVAYIGTDDGHVHALGLVDGGELWRYPGDGEEGLGAIRADLAYEGGLLYVGTQEGLLHVLDVSGEVPRLVCQFDAAAPIVSSPLLVDGVAYIPTTGQNIWVLPFGACDGVVADRLPFYVTETPLEIPPAIVGNTMYLPDGVYLYAKDLVTNTDVWPANTVNPDRPISAAPVVAGDTVYFGSEDGVVHAVDAITGETLWQWRTGLHVRGTPAVVDGVAFIVGGDGSVYAVGG